MIFSIVTFALFVAASDAGCVTCPNQCSGHGTCGLNFVCQCYDNYGMGLSHDSGDCSERICPYELAWVDTPDVLGRRHKYAECAGKGICNRDSGECECFPGFEGKGCGRTSCPNDCSGHGRCKYIEDLPYAASPFDYSVEFSEFQKTFPYYQWDYAKTRGCLCDPGYGDVDCSKRMCPYGTDIMDHRLNMLAAQKYQVQQIAFLEYGSTLAGKTFALTFKSKLNETFTTIPIVISTSDVHTFAGDVTRALKSLPNGVVDEVQVAAHYTSHELTLNVSFVGEAVQGPQFLMSVETHYCGDGCTPKITGAALMPKNDNVTEIQVADYNSYECGRRGKCDYTSGLCTCFEGYTGVACNTVTALV